MYKQQGMGFIKPYNLLSRDAYLAIVDEAKRQKIPVAGHVPVSMTATEASESRASQHRALMGRVYFRLE